MKKRKTSHWYQVRYKRIQIEIVGDDRQIACRLKLKYVLMTQDNTQVQQISIDFNDIIELVLVWKSNVCVYRCFLWNSRDRCVKIPKAVQSKYFLTVMAVKQEEIKARPEEMQEQVRSRQEGLKHRQEEMK